MKYYRPVIIHRRTKKEAEQAISDLLKRGYVVTHPLTEQRAGTKVFDRDKDNKHVFSHTTHSSYWVAKLERVEGMS